MVNLFMIWSGFVMEIKENKKYNTRQQNATPADYKVLILHHIKLVELRVECGQNEE